MPTVLGRRYEIDWLGDPPHMLKPDVPVWHRFLSRWGFLFSSLYYDCLLGGPPIAPGEMDDPIRRSWRISTSLRADAIAETDSHVWIIEVTGFAGLRSIGQLQTYRTAWIRDPVIGKPELTVLVCARIPADLLDACGQWGVLVYVV